MAYLRGLLESRPELGASVARDSRGRVLARTSRLYPPEKAFPGRASWWQVLQPSDLSAEGCIALVNEARGGPTFQVFLVPTDWLSSNRSSLAHVSGRDEYHVWLAADGADRFRDLRGGVLDFSPWRVQLGEGDSLEPSPQGSPHD